MAHLSIKLLPSGAYDLYLKDDGTEQLALEDDLRTLVLCAIETEARADASEAQSPDDRGGYWGDTYADVPGRTLGSRIWTLLRAKITPEVLARLETYIRDCLRKFVDDGIASQIDVTVARTGLISVGATVTIYRPNTAEPEIVELWQSVLDSGLD